MKILFYYRDSENIGMEYLSSVLKKEGHETELIFKTGTGSKFGMVTFKSFKKLDEDQKLIQKAKQFSPDILAFGCETDLYQDTLQMARKLKHVLNVPTIIGGKHATNLPEEVINEDCFDMLCRGEGEEAIVEAANNLEKGKDVSQIKNIWSKHGGEIIRNELRPLIQDLDSIPFPDRSLFHQYNAFGEQLMVIGSRGCPHNCSYCNNSYYRDLYKGKGKYIRRRSVDNIILEIKDALKKYKIRSVQFEDENFLVDGEWVKEFSEKYKEEIGLPFWCQANPNNITSEKIGYMKNANCKEIFMGVESGNEHIRKNVYNRHTTNEQIINSARTIKDAKILLQCTAIFSAPDETPKEMWDTVNLIKKIRPDAIPTYTLYPYYNTAVFEYAKKKGYLDEETIKKIKKGEQGSHGRSVLNHPYNDLGYNISKLLSLYVRVPKFIRPLIKKWMDNKERKMVDYAYMFLLPFDYPFVGREKIRIFFKNLLKEYS